MITVYGHAKINMYLRVLGRRADGFHDICSVTQSIGLADELVISDHAEDSVVMEGSIPEAENIVTKAIRLLKARTGSRRSARIRVRKRIPVGAGLGGGSADAAAALVGLNRLWRLGLGPQELEQTGRELGADVPLCLRGGTLLVEGRGERLTPLPALKDAHIVVASPEVTVATGGAYDRLDEMGGDGRAASVAGVIDALSAADLSKLANSMYNSFQALTEGDLPVIAALMSRAVEAGAAGASLSGTGAAVFSVSPTPDGAASVVEALRPICRRLFATEPVSEGVRYSSRQGARGVGR
ncbi:MAG: 4-(cytidine 5'-diphospho)-2-C-methyl-D-erythritol kinase [Terriglobia bacterium]